METAKLKQFSKRELRWDFYPMFLGLMQKGLDIEACLLILSTWNFAWFRYVARRFNLDRFKSTIKGLNPSFKKFDSLNFRNIDLNRYEKDIKEIFKSLASIDKIKKVGASKIMHLKSPSVFVPWDNRIWQYYGFRKGDENDYFEFLKELQRRFGKIKVPRGYRYSLAKLIDEHNYKTTTEPALRR
jgi:hypothetical protein